MADDCSFNREAVLEDLGQRGYAVIPNVCSAEDCDKYIAEFKEWLSQFEEDDWPSQMHSIIQGYSIGNHETTWKARLKTKPVFASIWETEKLLTSIDAVAISFPPETEKHGVFDTGSIWLHLDHAAEREGLHCYQGALYLEESSESDFCLRVLAGSHKHHKAFYEEFEAAARKSDRNGYYKLQEDEREWYKERDCELTKVPVPKGGMVLWDSRTVHDNCRPVKNRQHSDRWRFVVFACMTPAQWARPGDLAEKQRVYNNMLMTGHWPSQDINIFDFYVPSHTREIKVPKVQPDVAQTEEVRLLAGVSDYDFKDGKPNGPNWKPVWRTEE